MIKGDFHTHINGGGGGIIENAETIAIEAVHHGFSHIALGCHEWVCPKVLAEYIEEKYNIKVVRFAECWAEGCVHILALNVFESDIWSIKNRKPEFYIEEIKRVGGRAVMAHPYDEEVFKRVYRTLDGVEEWNTKSHKKFDYINNYDLSNLIKFNSSDFHVWEQPTEDFGAFTELPDNWFGKLV